MKQMNLLRALAADCRAHGEHDVARGIESVANDVAELCAAIKAERSASDKRDSIAYFEAKLRTTLALVKFQQANSHSAGVPE
ncbi:hypothetical protein [Pseudomonas sp.]|uniref:hypothetical protein n=1 Tax=Pseudomonas sp. TaxID=306 RepID=UPI003D0B6D44